jgi:uncharacterized protein
MKPTAQLFVIAKAPIPGQSKTRLSPPCTPAEAAAIAEAALADTLLAVAATSASRRGVVLDGEPGPWLPDGMTVIPQRGPGLGDRLAAAVEDCGTPSFIIDADTPQVTSDVLDHALVLLGTASVDAVLAPTADGGYWGIGLTRPAPVFDGVPMSTPRTGAAQLARLTELGLRTALLPILRDVDYWDDAQAVAAEIPDSAFARAVARVAVNNGLHLSSDLIQGSDALAAKHPQDL